MSGSETGVPETTDIAIVGAGAAGLAAAIFARRSNPARSVLLLDGAPKPGAKILVSGGSRCNVTNVTVTERDFCGGKPTIVRRVLRGLPVADTIAWFRQLGVSLHEEEHGKLFPDTNRSRDVLEALLRESDAAGAVLKPATRVQAVSRTADGFSLATSRGTIHAQSVVLATGGQSLPKTGSDGAGLEIARSLGHTIVPTTPSLVPLTLAADEVLHAQLRGVAQDVELSIWVEGAVSRRIRGALLWTHFGVSGPVVLDASRHYLRGQLEGRDTRITVNFTPEETFDTLDARWTSIASTRRRTSVGGALSDFLPGSAARALLGLLRIEGTLSLTDFPRADRRRLTHALLALPLPITGSRGYSYAEATAGGVALDEVDPSTMESRRTEGLYLVGEILDVDGRLGGFNFQWAWSSARVAATALAAGS